MQHYLSVVLFAGLMALSSAAAEPEAITIKIKETVQGDSYNIDATKTNKVMSKLVDAQGKVLMEMNEEATEIMTYKETVLKVEANKKPTKLEREYTKAEVKKAAKTEDLGLAGKTVLIERKGDKYTFTFKDGGEIKGAAAKVLAEEFKDKNEESNQMEKLLLPKNAVKAGDEWKLDMDPILKEFGKGEGIDIDKAKAAGTGKLVKAYKKDGKQFGELQFKMELPIKSLNNGQLKFPDGAKMVLEFSIDGCIDGTSGAGTNNMKMNLNGTAPIPNVGSLTLAVGVDVSQKQMEAKK
jgi:alpha-glucosidase (family GH31 glycosyl hydrolase)